MNADLQRFVHDALAHGLAREAIRGELVEAGWRGDEIEAALAAYRESGFPVPVPRRKPSLNARETFLYLVLFATLYTSAFNTGQVLFAPPSAGSPIRPLAHLLAPVRRVGARGDRRDPDRLSHLPLSLAGDRARGGGRAGQARPAGAQVAHLSHALHRRTRHHRRAHGSGHPAARGEAPPRFLLKVAVVLLIAAEVFGHYPGQLRREEDQTGRARGPAVGWRGLAACAVSSPHSPGCSSPARPRRNARQFDDQRVQALQQISVAIANYYQEHGELPGSLSSLLESPDGVPSQVLLDPAAGRRYAYQRMDSLTYELCAEFAAGDQPGARPVSEFWRHGRGQKCFRFEAGAEPRMEPRIEPRSARP
jgi:hypothetical protein